MDPQAESGERGRRCSLWLMPEWALRDELTRLIARLSRQYAAPLFPPHLTLLGDLTGDEPDLAARTQRLAARLRPFQVTLTSVDTRDEYFRCLFLRAAPTTALLVAERAARSLFEREPDPNFLPHLSLLYGDFDGEIKQLILESIGREFNRSFWVSDIRLFSTGGEPKDWRQVQSVELKGKQELSRD